MIRSFIGGGGGGGGGGERRGGNSEKCLKWGGGSGRSLRNISKNILTLCVRRSRKVDNAELPRPTAGEKTRQKNINLFPRAYLGNHAS